MFSKKVFIRISILIILLLIVTLGCTSNLTKLTDKQESDKTENESSKNENNKSVEKLNLMEKVVETLVSEGKLSKEKGEKVVTAYNEMYNPKNFSKSDEDKSDKESGNDETISPDKESKDIDKKSNCEKDFNWKDAWYSKKGNFKSFNWKNNNWCSRFNFFQKIVDDKIVSEEEAKLIKEQYNKELKNLYNPFKMYWKIYVDKEIISEETAEKIAAYFQDKYEKEMEKLKDKDLKNLKFEKFDFDKMLEELVNEKLLTEEESKKIKEVLEEYKSKFKIPKCTYSKDKNEDK